ncbi:MAG: isocitrate lyase/phosphoenolpyruvate mutase family protein [Bacteroidota bacterium]|nr:isocitrate lyase/phosphoenolpyruvate mutase family protein [Bacteroidota bacterium]
MFNKQIQAARAESFRQQHLSGKLLILPNIWDALGARLIRRLGYPSVATASVATAIANGYLDGEHIPFARLLEIVHTIHAAVDLPLTVDIERGFADTIPKLKENICQLIEQGAVGINIEDSKPDHKSLYAIDEQCRKIEAVREAAVQCGVPLVINARTDVFVTVANDQRLEQGIERGKAYQSAGADCIYPVLINSYEDIARFVNELAMPVNVLLMKSIPDLKRLEEMGVARVSLGPNLLNHVLNTMKQIAEGLKQYDTSAFFSQELLPREFRDSLAK